MNNTTRFILWLILAILLGLLWFGPWYPCWQEVFCPDCIKGAEETTLIGEETTEPETTVAAFSGPLGFSWDSADPVTSDDFEAYRQQILAGMDSTNILEITGLYHDGEPAPEGYENMGFARAAAIRNLFPEIPDERIALKARAVDEVEGVREGLFEAQDFNWLAVDNTEKESVEELDDRVIIRFPLNSTRRISDPAIEEYLDKLAARVIQTGEEVRLTGHTDNTGDSASNMLLGTRRAEAMEAVLLEKGVPQDQITVSSRGEEQPVASNNTEAGRAENRRVEVRFIKTN